MRPRLSSARALVNAVLRARDNANRVPTPAATVSDPFERIAVQTRIRCG
jgi:hypothetical protein